LNKPYLPQSIRKLFRFWLKLDARGNPGEYKIPQDRTTLLSNLKMERDLETKDQVQVFKEANSLSTDQEAIDAMKILEERDPQYTGLQKAPEPAQDQFAGGGNMIEKIAMVDQLNNAIAELFADIDDAVEANQSRIKTRIVELLNKPNERLIPLWMELGVISNYTKHAGHD